MSFGSLLKLMRDLPMQAHLLQHFSNMYLLDFGKISKITKVIFMKS